MAFSGVRISWLMLARKRVLASAASSARRLASRRVSRLWRWTATSSMTHRQWLMWVGSVPAASSRLTEMQAADYLALPHLA